MSVKRSDDREGDAFPFLGEGGGVVRWGCTPTDLRVQKKKENKKQTIRIDQQLIAARVSNTSSWHDHRCQIVGR